MAVTSLALMGIPRTGQATFDAKTEAEVVGGSMAMRQMGYTQAAMRGFRSIILILMGV